MQLGDVHLWGWEEQKLVLKTTQSPQRNAVWGVSWRSHASHFTEQQDYHSPFSTSSYASRKQSRHGGGELTWSRTGWKQSQNGWTRVVIAAPWGCVVYFPHVRWLRGIKYIKIGWYNWCWSFLNKSISLPAPTSLRNILCILIYTYAMIQSVWVPSCVSSLELFWNM